MATSGSFNTTGYNGRYLTLSWTQTSQSIANNSTTISWTLKGAGSTSFDWCYAQNFTVIINGETVFSKSVNEGQVKLYDGTVVATGSLTITHDSDGTKSFTASVSAGIYDWTANKTGSGTFSLEPIARASTLSANDGTLGTAQTLTIDKANSGFTHTITYECGNVTGTICSKSTLTTISWTPPIDLAKQNTTGVNVSITFTITTHSGSTNVGTSTKTIACSIPAEIVPSCTVSIERIPFITVLYNAEWWANNPTQILQGLTKINVNVSTIQAQSAPIQLCTTSFDGKTYRGTSFIMDAPSRYGSVKMVTTVTDSRGRSATTTSYIEVTKCPTPTISKLYGNRCNLDGTLNNRGSYIWVRCAFTSGFFTTELGNLESSQAIIFYKKTAETAWTELTVIDDQTEFSNVNDTDDSANTGFVFQADTSSAYDIKIEVTDYLRTVTSKAKVGSAYSLLHFNNSGNGIGIGKSSELENVLDIGMQTRHTGGLMSVELESGTDLNDITIANSYIGNKTTSSISYVNSPTTFGFLLEVLLVGTKGSVKQRVTEENYAASRVYERVKRSDAAVWTSWVRVPNFEVYPVGSIYLSVTSTNPATLFGGTWERIKDCFLLAAGDTYAAGATGGEAEHTLTVDEIPKHMHSMYVGNDAATSTLASKWTGVPITTSLTKKTYYSSTIPVNSSGGDGAHNNMPPYLAVYVWKRTA